jgi:hypothetical protein
MISSTGSHPVGLILLWLFRQSVIVILKLEHKTCSRDLTKLAASNWRDLFTVNQ